MVIGVNLVPWQRVENMASLTHLGQYWSASRRELRILGGNGLEVSPQGQSLARAWDLTDCLALPSHRRNFSRENREAGWEAARWTCSGLPTPMVELVEWLESRQLRVGEWAAGFCPQEQGAEELDFSSLGTSPLSDSDHLVAPVIPRRAQAFGVTYLNSALERETEGSRGDYGFVYRAVKERGERPELFLKGTSPEHFVGPGGRMGLRTDLTNSEDMEGNSCNREVVSAGIEPELAAVVHSDGRIWGYTLANDVSGNRMENETLLYLYQAKHFTGALVLGPLILLSDNQSNPNLDIRTRILAAGGEELFERESNSSQINAPLGDLVSWAASHIRLQPAEVFSTGTNVVPDGPVKVLSEGMTVQISCPEIGLLSHGAGPVEDGSELNPDYARLQFEGGGE